MTQKLKKFTVKKGHTVYISHRNEYEQFHIIQGSANYDDYVKLKKILNKLQISYTYLGLNDKKEGFHIYDIHLKYKDMELKYRYTGYTDHYDNVLKVYSILYDIVEIYTSDKNNPFWDKDKDIQPKLKKMFTDEEIKVFPQESI